MGMGWGQVGRGWGGGHDAWQARSRKYVQASATLRVLPRSRVKWKQRTEGFRHGRTGVRTLDAVDKGDDAIAGAVEHQARCEQARQQHVVGPMVIEVFAENVVAKRQCSDEQRRR